MSCCVPTWLFKGRGLFAVAAQGINMNGCIGFVVLHGLN